MLTLIGLEIDFLHNIGEIVLRLALAVLLGGLIGFEREFSGKAAGLRTNILICLGAAAFTLGSIFFAEGTTADLSRVAAQIVTGIGFLGAGTIIQARGEVQGLTSAATIWVVASIGLAAGCGYYSLAIVTTAFAMISLLILGWMEKSLLSKRETKQYEITMINSTAAIEKVQKLLREGGADLELTGIRKDGDEACLTYRVTATTKSHEALSKTLSPLPEVRGVLFH
ncbi:MAG: MgtC/SapB family protein [Planctomycetota bacterium]|nr:MgtC/SapB family protein [Planctomycetota bacterium]